MVVCGTVASNLKCIKCKDCFNRVYEEQIKKLKQENEKLHSNAKLVMQLLKDQKEVLDETNCPNCLLVGKMLDEVIKRLGEQ